MGNALAVAVTCGHTSCGCDVLLTVAVGGRSNEAGRNVIEKKTVEDNVDDRGCCTREQASPPQRGLEIYTSRCLCAEEDGVDDRGCRTRERASILTGGSRDLHK